MLQDVAYLLRKQLRAFDLAYRIGGEEFLVLLPGADLDQTAAMAERLRRGVEADTVGGGLRVTMSFGVSASGASGLRLPERLRRGRRGSVRGQAPGAQPRLHRRPGRGRRGLSTAGRPSDA